MNLIPGRECGDCTVCCVALAIDEPEIQKRAAVPCRHCGAGCTIYEVRPPVCRTFYCAWRTDDRFGADRRPDKCGVLGYEQKEGIPDSFGRQTGTALMLLDDPLTIVRRRWFQDFVAAGVMSSIPLVMALPPLAGKNAPATLLNTDAMVDAIARGKVQEGLEAELRALRACEYRPAVFAHSGNDVGSRPRATSAGALHEAATHDAAGKKRIAILVIAATSEPVYVHYINHYWSDFIAYTNTRTPHIRVFLLFEHDADLAPYKHLRDNILQDDRADLDTLCPPQFQMAGVPGILSKTLYALERLHDQYDVFFRTNLSSIIRLPQFDDFVQARDHIVYSGPAVWEDALRDDLLAYDRVGPGKSIASMAELDCYPGNTFISGYGYFLNPDEARLLVRDRTHLRYDLPDDVAVGLMLSGHEILTDFSLTVTAALSIAEAVELMGRSEASHVRLEHFPPEHAEALWEELQHGQLWRPGHAHATDSPQGVDVAMRGAGEGRAPTVDHFSPADAAPQPDIIVTIAAGYTDVEQYRAFVSTLRRTGATCPVLVGVSDIPECARVRTYLLENGVSYFAVPDVPRHKVASFRFEQYRQWLERIPFRYALLLDVRDTYFQLDPFRQIDTFMHDCDLYLMSEFKFLTIGNHPNGMNYNWILEAFGRDAADAVADRVILNSGAILGRRTAILKLLNAMASVTSAQDYEFGDQGTLNYLAHSGRLDHCGRTRIARAGLSLVNNCGFSELDLLQETRPLTKSEAASVAFIPRDDAGKLALYRDREGRVLDDDGTVSHVVHQYDRFMADMESFVTQLSRYEVPDDVLVHGGAACYAGEKFILYSRAPIDPDTVRLLIRTMRSVPTGTKPLLLVNRRFDPCCVFAYGTLHTELLSEPQDLREHFAEHVVNAEIRDAFCRKWGYSAIVVDEAELSRANSRWVDPVILSLVSE